MSKLSQPFYPPRARWYSWTLYPWFATCRMLHLEHVRWLGLPPGFTFLQCVFSLVLPGCAFFVAGRRSWGWGFLAAYFHSAILFLVALGYLFGGVAFGVMISAHAASIIFLEGHWLRSDCRFGIRLGLAVVTVLVVWKLVYAPLIGLMERHWVTPMRVQNNVVIVHSQATPSRIEPGDWVMYSLLSRAVGDPHGGDGAVRLQSGYGWGPVQAVAGDRVSFSADAFFVNGHAHPRRPHMPASGELVVPAEHWFIWPAFDISRPENVSEENLSAVMLQVAMVAESDFIGKPFKRWFGRRQNLS